jgi:regulator of ribonuclease activity A
MTGTADLCDAREDVQACTLALRGFGRRRRFAGPIRTVLANGDILTIREVLSEPGLGHVLVIDAAGSVHAYFGDFMAGLVLRNQWAGVVVNGGARDSAELDRLEIGVKALGTHPRRGERTGKGVREVPVNFGGVTFLPGRWLVADDDGVVVLPEGMADSP